MLSFVCLFSVFCPRLCASLNLLVFNNRKITDSDCLAVFMHLKMYLTKSLTLCQK